MVAAWCKHGTFPEGHRPRVAQSGRGRATTVADRRLCAARRREGAVCADSPCSCFHRRNKRQQSDIQVCYIPVKSSPVGLVCSEMYMKKLHKCYNVDE